MKIDESKYPWFVLDIAIFIAINAILLRIARPYGALRSFLLWEFILFGLAVYRAADVISNESITKPLRDPFVKDVEQDGKVVEVPVKKGFRGAVGHLLYCPSCTGMWMAMVLVYGYLLSPQITAAVVLILALSGIERIFFHTISFLKKLHST